MVNAMISQKAKLLALTAATFAIMVILIPGQHMPKEHLTVVIAGGLTGFAAVINTFDVRDPVIFAGIILSVVPIFIYFTSTWRLPRNWEWATWSALASIIVIGAILAMVNTSIGLLVVSLLGEDQTIAIMALAIGISVLILFIALSALVVKAVGMASAHGTSTYIKSQALGNNR